MIVDELPDQGRAGAGQALEADDVFDPFTMDGVRQQVIVDTALNRKYLHYQIFTSEHITIA